MLIHSQFKENEVWTAFKMNISAIRTEQNGDVTCVALMDAATGSLLCNHFVPVGDAEPSLTIAKKMLDDAKLQQEGFPASLMLPAGQFADGLPSEAKRRAIDVVYVPKNSCLRSLHHHETHSMRFSERDICSTPIVCSTGSINGR